MVNTAALHAANASSNLVKAIPINFPRQPGLWGTFHFTQEVFHNELLEDLGCGIDCLLLGIYLLAYYYQSTWYYDIWRKILVLTRARLDQRSRA